MRLTIESTDTIVQVNGLPARHWTGRSDAGVAIHVFVAAIAVPVEADQAEFETELRDLPAPRIATPAGSARS